MVATIEMDIVPVTAESADSEGATSLSAVEAPSFVVGQQVNGRF